MKLVLFDFDGTLTTSDTYSAFILKTTNRFRLLLGTVLLLPAIILHKLKLIPSPIMRTLVSKISFWRVSQCELENKANNFVASYLPSVMRKDMFAKLLAHIEQGDTVVLVSASLSVYLQIWCEDLGIELVCSEMEVRKGRFTGAYTNGDCSGERKVTHVLQRYNIDDYDSVIAYGDTDEDIPMLNIADTRFYRGKVLTQ